METRSRVILASASPRRVALLAQVIGEFEVVPADVDESPLEDEKPVDTAVRLAEAKALAVAALHPDAIVIGADTIVECDGVSLGKPVSVEDAADMLRRLSGRTHRVITGVCVVSCGKAAQSVDTTSVTFRVLDQDEIRRYAASGEPMDKAGGYAIQGGAAKFVSKVDGSLSNVIGLPLESLPGLLGPIAV